MSLGRNILWNLLAFVWLSLLVILVTPFMVHRMGLDAFGVWCVLIASMGAVNALDLGLGSALIRYLASEHERGDRAAMEALLRSGLTLQTLVGVVTAVAFFFLAAPLVHSWVRIPPPLMDEALASFRISAVAVLLGFPGGAFAAPPPALRRFDLQAGRIMFFNTVYYGAAVAALQLGGGLFEVALAYAVGIVLMFACMVLMSARLLPGVKLLPGWHADSVRKLLDFGRYKFPAQLSTSLLQQFDRFAVGALLPVAQVSFYAVPVRISQRVTQVVEQIVSPFYPTVASHLVAGRHRELSGEFRGGVRLVAAVAAGAVAVVGGLAHPILDVWMGVDFANQGTWPLRILLLAYAASAMAALPSLSADAADRPAIPAAFLVSGSILHVPLVLVLTASLGLTGASLGVLAGFLIPLAFGVPAIHRRIPQLPGLRVILLDIRGALLAALATGVAASFFAHMSFPRSGVTPLLATLTGVGMLYAGFLFGLGGLRVAEVRRLVSALQGTRAR